MNKIIIAGGTGFLGQLLIEHFKKKYEVVVLTRGSIKADNSIRYVLWDGKNQGTWATELEGALAVINLSGKSVNCRYNNRNKKKILTSRLNSTGAIGRAIEKCVTPPKKWINAASATIYRHAEDREMNEFTGELGTGFSVKVCKAWEWCFNQFELPDTKKVLFRTAMVLGKNGGVFPVFKRLVKFGLGGKMGDGNQYISWIAAEDFIRSIEWAIKNEKAEGTYNCCAPNPITNESFMYLMRDYLKIPFRFGLPAARWMLEIGTWVMRTETELILKSRRVVPAKLVNEGFEFEYPFVAGILKQYIEK